uniref:Uncharacterized protein n=1 Tax=viral metagenome TaxID=1070528 RepID=A0A6M3JMC1_9ZZZZ
MTAAPSSVSSVLVVCCVDAECPLCGGRGVGEVRALRPPKHRASPCCGAAWRTASDPHGWACSKCGVVYERKAVVGW